VRSAPPARWVPTGRDMLLGLALHVALGTLLGYGSILPIDLSQLSLFDGVVLPSALDEYAWELVILSALLPYLCRHDIAGREALWIDRTDWSLILVLVIGAFMLDIVSEFAIDGLLPTPSSTPDENIREGLGDLRDAPLDLALYAACISLVGPVVEELVFRGWLYTHLRARLPALPTIVLTGALFGLLHGGPLAYALSIVVSGMIYGALREWTGGIVAPTATHILNNTIATLGDL
jgi:membrane protease YdiL (CAAX protease family)